MPEIIGTKKAFRGSKRGLDGLYYPADQVPSLLAVLPNPLVIPAPPPNPDGVPLEVLQRVVADVIGEELGPAPEPEPPQEEETMVAFQDVTPHILTTVTFAKYGIVVTFVHEDDICRRGVIPSPKHRHANLVFRNSGIEMVLYPHPETGRVQRIKPLNMNFKGVKRLARRFLQTGRLERGNRKIIDVAV